MSAKIHYEDNLFFLHSILRTVEAGLRLDINVEFFGDKILEDVFFVDAMLLRTMAALKENDQLVNRTAYLRSLRRTVTAYSSFIDRAIAGDLGYNDIFSPYTEKLTASAAAHSSIRREIDALLDRIEPDEETNNIVSSEEFGFLLADESRE